MKVLIILFITLFLQGPWKNVSAQSWSPEGAKWHYNYTSQFYTVGYVEISYTGDTMIGTITAKKLSKRLYGYNHFDQQYKNESIGKEYTYEQNGVVYLYHNNSWDTLYNWNALPGDTWTYAGSSSTNACDSNSTITVTDTGTRVINGINLKYQVVELDYVEGSTYTDTIIEKMGFIHSYMLPFDMCDAALDANEGGPFRCYSDSQFQTFSVSNEACDYIPTGIEETQAVQTISFYPNPSRSQVIFTLSDKYSLVEVQIHDLSGTMVNEFALTNGNHKSISSLAPGVYIVSTSTSHQLISQERLVVLR